MALVVMAFLLMALLPIGHMENLAIGLMIIMVIQMLMMLVLVLRVSEVVLFLVIMEILHSGILVDFPPIVEGLVVVGDMVVAG